MTNDYKARDEEELLFYALIGYCVTRYQSVEDYLETVFTAAIGVERQKSGAIYRVARGLEAKLDIITAAFIGADDDHAAKWGRLCGRIASAASARNRIAHASPVFHGGVYTTILGENEVVSVAQTEPARMELHKTTKGGTTVWTVSTLREEHQRSRELFLHLVGFVLELEGKLVGEHLRGG